MKKKKRINVAALLRQRRRQAQQQNQPRPTGAPRGRARPANNTTCDIYYSPNVPPAAADVAGTACAPVARFAPGQEGSEAGEGDRTFFWTSILEAPLGTNLPDLYPGGASQTTVWVPDQNGDAYTVVFVERERAVRGTDFLRAYLVKGYVMAITVKEAD